MPWSVDYHVEMFYVAVELFVAYCVDSSEGLYSADPTG